jgi:hypothetical protein
MNAPGAFEFFTLIVPALKVLRFNVGHSQPSSLYLWISLSPIRDELRCSLAGRSLPLAQAFGDFSVEISSVCAGNGAFAHKKIHQFVDHHKRDEGGIITGRRY